MPLNFKNTPEGSATRTEITGFYSKTEAEDFLKRRLEDASFTLGYGGTGRIVEEPPGEWTVHLHSFNSCD